MIVRRVEALARCSTATTARTCSLAIAAPPTSCAPRRRRTARAPSPGAHDASALVLPEEKALAAALAGARAEAAERVASEDFEGAMRALARVARAGRRILPQGHRQRRRSRTAPQPPAPARRAARRRPHGGGFFQDRRLTAFPSPLAGEGSGVRGRAARRLRANPSSGVALQRHLLPQGEKGLAPYSAVAGLALACGAPCRPNRRRARALRWRRRPASPP